MDREYPPERFVFESMNESEPDSEFDESEWCETMRESLINPERYDVSCEDGVITIQDKEYYD